ncbi:hypothetical protein CerSpe_027180 [Prunus speciosa]
MAAKIDLKCLDEQLENLHRMYSMKKKKGLHGEENKVINVRAVAAKEVHEEEDWKIIREKLVVKQVFACGGFGSVDKGIYDGQEVAVKVVECGEDGQRRKADTASLKKDFR